MDCGKEPGLSSKSSREHDRTLGRGEAVKLVLWRWMGGGGPRGRSERPGQDGVGGKKVAWTKAGH